MIQLQDGNALVPAGKEIQEAAVFGQAEADDSKKELLALPGPEGELPAKKLSADELQETLGKVVAAEAASEKRRIAAEIKELQGRIAKAVIPRKRRRTKGSRIGSGEAQLSSGAEEGSPSNAGSPSSPTAEQQDEYSANAFMTQYPQSGAAQDVRYNEELQVDVRSKEMAEFKKSKTWRENE